MRYAAFISYNHRDRRTAAWLHRSLETYRFPRRLHGRATPFGPLGDRLPPIFQDREELATSADLALSVRVALEDAASLIVICSPDGARSRWVNEEIRAFVALGRRDRIQCLIVAGEPNASRGSGGDPGQECLPPALFDHGGHEPLASDMRAGQDGRAIARLKLLAGITGLGFDELRQREQARRYRRLLLSTGVLGVALALMTTLAILALASRREAIAQRDIARRKTITAERTVDFVKSMFAVADPAEAKGATVTAREIVDRGAARVATELEGQPAVRAELQTTLGEVYANLGLLPQGSALVEQGMRTPGLDAGLRARQQLALAEVRGWQADDARAAAAYAHALSLARDPASGRADLIPRILAGYGETLSLLNRSAAGERAVREALRLDRARGPVGDVDVARDLEALGRILADANRLDEARRAYRLALNKRLRHQGELHPRAFQDLSNLGSIAYLQGNATAAEEYFSRSLPLAVRVLGRRHPEYAMALNNVARLRIERRDYAGALPLLRDAVAIQRAQRGADTSELILPLFNLALASRGMGRGREATALLNEDRLIAAAARHRHLAPILIELADLACSNGDVGRADTLLTEARPLVARDYADEPWRSAWIDLVAAQCRRKPIAAAARATILARWPASTHFGARAASVR